MDSDTSGAINQTFSGTFHGSKSSFGNIIRPSAGGVVNIGTAGEMSGHISP